MNPEWLDKYRPLSGVLMEYGWFVAPFLVGWEFKAWNDLLRIKHPHRAVVEPHHHPI